MWESGGCSALSPKDSGSPESWTESCPGAGYKSRSRLAGLLSRRNTASHRCISGPDAGRSPSIRRRHSRHAETLFPSRLLLKSVKKQKAPIREPAGENDSLRRHYPHQVIGSKRILPLSPEAPLFFASPLSHRGAALSSFRLQSGKGGRIIIQVNRGAL